MHVVLLCSGADDDDDDDDDDEAIDSPGKDHTDFVGLILEWRGRLRRRDRDRA